MDMNERKVARSDAAVRWGGKRSGRICDYGGTAKKKKKKQTGTGTDGSSADHAKPCLGLDGGLPWSIAENPCRSKT